ncbi:prepilin peptidase [Microbacterium phosphatis]|uniref:A24 family peptidase n=1 Tax=Microbacterium phosphatis TaxID=3140248 RepID=UPI00314019D2
MAGSDVLALVAHAAFLAVALILIRIDVREHRLPDVIVLPAAAGLALLLGLADGDRIGRAALGGLMLFAFYLLVRAAVPSGLGGGDVKLAAVVGLVLGWHGWVELAAGAAAAFVLGGLHAVALLATGRASRGSHLAFGPWMLAGAWLAMAL